VLYCVPQLYTVISTHIREVLTGVLATRDCLICVFGVFSPICFELSVPVEVIAWKDSSPK